MKLSHIVSAAALAGFAVHASAAGGDLGAIPPSASFSATHAGAFEDIWKFNLGTPSFVAASLTNVEVTFLGAIGGIVGFGAELNGVSLLPSSSTTITGPVSVKVQILAGSSPLLPVGMYELKVFGANVTGGTASYGGNLVAAPIPEPETYALMLAGLGVVGFVAARRRPRV